ncbi:MAG: succinylglutamate desuccinylase/aspartoacylase family protein [Succinivibrio sp.]
MKKEVLYSMKSPFRDDFKIMGYTFGEGKKSLAIVGSMRGDEIAQMYVCSQIVKELATLETHGYLANDVSITVIPSVNPFSMNIGKRFWAMDDTDINRMFPGYDLGETTQRIAAGLFKNLDGFEYGIQLASFYMPGDFIPHVRILNTAIDYAHEGCDFGLPYVSISDPSPFDTTLLNYNWQIWNTKTFSLYGGTNEKIEGIICKSMVNAILRFMIKKGMVRKKSYDPAFVSEIIHEKDLIVIQAPSAGIFYRKKNAGDFVRKGDELGRIIDPYEGTLKARLYAYVDGIMFFTHDKPLCLQNTPLFKIYGAE